MIPLKSIRVIVFIGVLAITGILLVQWFLLRQAYNKQEADFEQRVQTALLQTSKKLTETYKTSPLTDVVKKMAKDYYVVNTGVPVDFTVLEPFLKETLEEKNVKIDFEYGIYDCEKKCMSNCAQVNPNGETSVPITHSKLAVGNMPGWNYYFGIKFPNKAAYLNKSLGNWMAFSIILLLALGFFAYAIYVIVQQRQQYQMQRDFVSNMTHEFKTPLSSVKVAADYLSKQYKDADPRTVKYLEIIQNQNTRLNKLVENVLQNAQTEKKDFQLQLGNYEVVSMLQQIVHNASAKHGDNAEISMHTNLSAKTILLDEMHFINTIDSLIENAVKYSEPLANVNISLLEKDKQLIIEIADKGIGIESKYLKDIFKKFFRVPTGNIHNRKGYGLGLFYVQNIVKKHGWQIKVHSEKNIGTQFQITVPYT
jgi:two-component system, OmpR family, phosphate regulon sensor histidine kinase PhoR